MLSPPRGWAAGAEPGVLSKAECFAAASQEVDDPEGKPLPLCTG